MAAFAWTIFTGAFLLFQVQPLIGKYILPWFGGGPGVWTTCMLFFQIVLLAGYAYAHVSARCLKPRAQAITHLVLLLAALALLPITPADHWKPTDGGDPTLRILALLGTSLGLPYFVLSATGPLLQHWFSRSKPGASPFRLYALSNLGSLLALISYPAFFETHFTRKSQAGLWAWGLLAYAIGCAFCARKVWQTPSPAPIPSSQVKGKAARVEITAPTSGQKILWLLLPACASVLLLATTNKICQDIAVIPFLWVLPLALYLLTFIICFDSPRWYKRLPYGVALVAALGAICWTLFNYTVASTFQQIAIYTVGLFICCMVCHGELYRLKPDPLHLTGYYLLIAAGGALGGLLVAVVAPLIFSDYFELHWGLLLCGLLFAITCARDRASSPRPQWQLPVRISLGAGVVALAAALWVQAHQFSDIRVCRSRNFYGVLTVYEFHKNDPDQHSFQLAHGRTAHGLQFVDSQRAAQPTLYFSEHSGVGLALQALPPGHRRIGIVGLGAGTLAAYARPGDYVRIYEINPEVLRLAESRFTYLSKCQGKLEFSLGDARLALEREAPQGFDLLILDAFNSDSIPVHLLTEEAFALYARHLKPNGTIAVHITNLSLNLEPVVANLALRYNYQVATVEHRRPHDQWWVEFSTWMLLSHSQDVLGSSPVCGAARSPRLGSDSPPLWTDDFASLFQILRWDAAWRTGSESAEDHARAASLLAQRQDWSGAIERYRRALQLDPDFAEALNNLAWLLAASPDPSLRNGAAAVQLAERACALTRFRQTMFVGTLAAAYAEAGRFQDAVTTAEKACALASETGDQALLTRNQELLALYRSGQAFHEPPTPIPGH